MSDLVTLTATKIIELVRRGEVSRAEVMQAHLDRIDATNEHVNALSHVHADKLLAEARAADAASRPRGTLDGVPMSIKSMFDVAGLPSTHGSARLTTQVPTKDCTVAARLRGQGAFVVGKGNQPDFAMRFNTVSSETGWTRNPRDLTKSVGGSSGGDAAAVAAGMVAIGFGTDLAGSIRVPSAFCGVYGLRTTPGRVPFDPQDVHDVRTPAAEAMSSQGPIARSVADLELAFAATAGAGDGHPFSIPAAQMRTSASGPVRIARVTTQAGMSVDRDVVDQVELVSTVLQDQGYPVEDACFPSIARTPELWGELLCTELRLRALPALRQAMEPTCFEYIDEMSQIWPTCTDTETYIARWEEWARIRRELLAWMRQYPLIIAPIASVTLPLPLDYDHDLRGSSMAAHVATFTNSLWPACLGLPVVCLPNGVQLIAAPHRDESIFTPARIAEAALPSCDVSACL